jgi:hypothetical protein
MIAVGGSLALAGCTEGESDTGDEPTPSPSASGDDASGGGESTAEPTASPTETPTPAGTDEAGPTLGQLDVAFENTYRFSIDSPDLDGTIEGAWDGGNYVSRVSVDGETVETYLVDGDTYIVAGGSCSAVPGSGGGATGVDTESLANTDETESNVEQFASLTPTGTATIDGETTYVYELRSGQQGLESDVTYYVSATTGRLRRVETQGVTIDYYDWGEVEPITAPC